MYMKKFLLSTLAFFAVICGFAQSAKGTLHLSLSLNGYEHNTLGTLSLQANPNYLDDGVYTSIDNNGKGVNGTVALNDVQFNYGKAEVDLPLYPATLQDPILRVVLDNGDTYFTLVDEFMFVDPVYEDDYPEGFDFGIPEKKQIKIVSGETTNCTLTLRKYTYLYNDGTTGTDPLAKTAIGVVVSDSVSANDSDAGYTGYAMALKNAPFNGSYGMQWSANEDIDAENQTGHDLDNYEFMNDVDGYRWTKALSDQETDGIDIKFPAAYAAKNYNEKAPESTSGWYLPAAGQWVYVLWNLCGMDHKFDQGYVTMGVYKTFPHLSQVMSGVNNAVSVFGSDYCFQTRQNYWASSASSYHQAYYIGSSRSQVSVYTNLLLSCKRKNQELKKGE